MPELCRRLRRGDALVGDLEAQKEAEAALERIHLGLGYEYGISGIDSAYIRQALGDFPLIGMFGGYELAPLGTISLNAQSLVLGANSTTSTSLKYPARTKCALPASCSMYATGAWCAKA